jgi:hypothetical protein
MISSNDNQLAPDGTIDPDGANALYLDGTIDVDRQSESFGKAEGTDIETEGG